MAVKTPPKPKAKPKTPPKKASPPTVPDGLVTSPIDVVFSFDDTGSMSPCIAQVRRVVTDTTKQLFRDIPNLRIGIIVHGDYCDGPKPVSILDLTDNQGQIAAFVNERRNYGGGDLPECYEQVLHDSRSLAWRAGKHKVLVMIGDNIPHPPSYHLNKKKLDWRNELGLLLEQGINVYGVQALGYPEADRFYAEIAEKTGGFHLRLEQFAQIPDLIKAVCYQQAGQLATFEKTLVAPTPSFTRIIDTLSGRKPKPPKPTKYKLEAVPAWRFQILEVDEDCPIREFVQSQGLEFTKGNGYYEFTKTETVQDYKEVILQDRDTEEFYTGKKVRQILGLPESGSVRMKPGKDQPYRFFVQSTSVNRKLKAGTSFLYQVDTSK